LSKSNVPEKESQLIFRLFNDVFNEKFLAPYPGFYNVISTNLLNKFISYCINHPEENSAQEALENIIKFAYSKDLNVSHPSLLKDLRSLMSHEVIKKYSQLTFVLPQEATEQEYKQSRDLTMPHNSSNS
jgi:hypothetical protein